MRKLFVAVAVTAAVLALGGTVAFRYGLELSWLDSVYFVLTTISTVGYGDISLRQAPPALKIFGMFLMVAGPAVVAATFGLITDALLRTRLRDILGQRRRRAMRQHIVLCGLGNVGIRTLRELRSLGEQVAVVGRSADSRFFDEARRLKPQLFEGDIRDEATLQRAGVEQAKCIIALSDDDLANLAAVLHARTVNPEIRVVIRLFDQHLARKVQAAFNIKAAFSTSHLAAPAFAMAAVDETVIGSFYLDDQIVLNVELQVAQGSRLAHMTTEQLRALGDLSLLSYRSSDGITALYPSEDRSLEAGDRVVLSATPARARQITALNAPA